MKYELHAITGRSTASGPCAFSAAIGIPSHEAEALMHDALGYKAHRAIYPREMSYVLNVLGEPSFQRFFMEPPSLDKWFVDAVTGVYMVCCTGCKWIAFAVSFDKDGRMTSTLAHDNERQPVRVLRAYLQNIDKGVCFTIRLRGSHNEL